MRVTAIALGLLVAGCGEPHPEAERGRLLLRQYGCGACHAIPGVAGANGNVGPPLAGVASRVYLGGVLANTPENMARFIRAPQSADPLTAMPDLRVDARHAQDMVAYLNTLR